MIIINIFVSVFIAGLFAFMFWLLRDMRRMDKNSKRILK